MNDSPDPAATASGADAAPDRLAADLRAAVGALVRATRSEDRLAPIPAAVLDLLDARGALTTAELAAGRGVRHQTMAATVKELTAAGHLAAGDDPSDARKKVLTLTAAGKAALEEDRRHRVALLSRTLADTLDAAERAELARALTLLDRVTAALAEHGAAPRTDRGPVTGAW
ncbi:MarR family winged helix-turn-helix transcriptional regulator [Kitasatospora sp. NPDC057198]|uniref:MarR family winged helix-turn-helix transcriptional regulator n=1 Tax=Kitasatospora sp. NPDC057198 TaxID=3346046 RepID=UPI0036254D8C